MGWGGGGSRSTKICKLKKKLKLRNLTKGTLFSSQPHRAIIEAPGARPLKKQLLTQKIFFVETSCFVKIFIQEGVGPSLYGLPIDRFDRLCGVLPVGKGGGG